MLTPPVCNNYQQRILADHLTMQGRCQTPTGQPMTAMLTSPPPPPCMNRPQLSIVDITSNGCPPTLPVWSSILDCGATESPNSVLQVSRSIILQPRLSEFKFKQTSSNDQMPILSFSSRSISDASKACKVVKPKARRAEGRER